jgi:hypothetical protein
LSSFFSCFFWQFADSVEISCKRPWPSSQRKESGTSRTPLWVHLFFTARLSRTCGASLRPQRLCLPYEIHVNEERSGFHWGGEYFFKRPFLAQETVHLSTKKCAHQTHRKLKIP